MARQFFGALKYAPILPVPEQLYVIVFSMKSSKWGLWKIFRQKINFLVDNENSFHYCQINESEEACRKVPPLTIAESSQTAAGQQITSPPSAV